MRIAPLACLAALILTTAAYAAEDAMSENGVGARIAAAIEDESLSEFKAAMAKATITEPYDAKKGYTVVAPRNGTFDEGDHPMSYYIINQRISISTLEAKYDSYPNLLGDDIGFSKVANSSRFIDGERYNGSISTDEGIIYRVGGFSDSDSETGRRSN